MQTTKQLGFQSRAAQVAANTYNEAENTIEVVFATDTPVLRSTWDGNYNEVLSIDTAAMRMERINAGAPVLNNHRSWGGVDSQLGKVERAWVDNGVAKAILRFSKRADVQPIIQDIRDGIISSVSVGYRVYKYEEQAAPEPKASPNGSRADTTPTYIARDWEPYEISMVSIPADTKSGVRADGDTPNDVILITNNIEIERKMATENPNPPAPTLTDEQVRAAQEAATKAERARAQDIRLAARKAGLGDDFATLHIDNGATLDAFRAAAFDELEKRNAKIGTPTSHADTRVTADETDKRRDAAEAAIMLRSGAAKEADFSADVVAAARQYRRQSLLDMAKDALIRGGDSEKTVNQMSKMELIGRAITSNTSDFAVILEGTNRRILLAQYAIAADTWRKFCAVGSVSDFREYKRLRMGSFSDLEVLRENGEYRTKEITDADYEKVSVATKGNMINVSRQMIINDDLAAFTRLAGMLGRAAARSIENDVYAALLSNSGNGPSLVDGNPIFHASHNNIVGAGALSIAQLEAARVKMGLQKEKDGNDYLDLNPSILLINKAQGGTARIYNQSQYDTDVTSKFQVPNKVAGLFNSIIDSPRIPDDAAFYMFADPNIEPVFEVNFLDGQQSPYMESKDGWKADGIEWKIRLDYGVGAVGFRGAVKVPKV